MQGLICIVINLFSKYLFNVVAECFMNNVLCQYVTNDFVKAFSYILQYNFDRKRIPFNKRNLNILEAFYKAYTQRTSWNAGFQTLLVFFSVIETSFGHVTINIIL